MEITCKGFRGVSFARGAEDICAKGKSIKDRIKNRHHNYLLMLSMKMK
jgi:hypothetical protein